ncbi:hypothetical protein GGF46_000340 [Coemansia sp. RSA 552]|nr:hypothetical protein GGF46_000340 [Coemansia sp. RSA 552]
MQGRVGVVVAVALVAGLAWTLVLLRWPPSTSQVPQLALSEHSSSWATLDGRRPRLVGHRGEKSFLPEHTLASIWQAALEGADVIEADLALTRDGQLVVFHNEWLGETTDIAQIAALAHLQRNATWEAPDGGQTLGRDNEWFIADLTLDELRLVRVRQERSYPWRPHHFDGLFGILTFDEWLAAIRELEQRLGRPFDVMVELKSSRLYNHGRTYPRFFEDRAILTLQSYGWGLAIAVNASAHADLVVAQNPPVAQTGSVATWQSFDADTAAYLAGHSDVPVVALVDVQPWALTPQGLDRLSSYARIVSPWKDFFVAGAEACLRAANVTWDPAEIAGLGGFIAPSDLVHEIHARNMTVSPYTFYDSHQDMDYLCQKSAVPGACPRTREEELYLFFELGTDYLFVENIVEARLALQKYTNKHGQ